MLAMKRDCLFWPLRLDPKDRDYDVFLLNSINRQVKYRHLRDQNLHSYELFCLEPEFKKIPWEFVKMMSILRGDEKEEMSVEFKKAMIVEAIRERMSEYITVAVSDRTRSR